MADRPYKILVVEPDADLLEMMVASLAQRFDAHVTCVADGESCLDTDLLEPHDLVLSELSLYDMDGIDLAGKLMAISHRPVILMADDPDYDDVVAAMRLGVRDVFRKPFPIGELLDAIDRALHGHNVRRKHAVKHRQMRDLLRQVIRERRDLKRRMELVCRDLVGAHRRLVHRVLAKERTSPKVTE